MDVEKVIRDYLPTVIHMSLGTCSGDKPWVCEVHFAYDDSLNLYFISKPSTRHGQEIAKNSNVAGNIVAQHKEGQDVRGVYFEGTAELLEDFDKDSVAYKIYADRAKLSDETMKEITDAGFRFYKITADSYFVFDNRETKPGQKFELKWGK